MNNDATQMDPSKGIKAGGSLDARALLLVVSGPDFGTIFPLETQVTIGRAVEGLGRIADPQASKAHCSVTPEKGKFILEDLGSTNGTWLNRKRLKKPQQLYYGDRIVAGTTVLRFFQEEKVEKK